MEKGIKVATIEGTPQGGIISPLLCNVALNGMENAVKSCGRKIRGITPGIKVIRYADDVVITGKNEKILRRCRIKLEEFLKPRGLKLNEMKSQIIHLCKGINFLGFNIRRQAWRAEKNVPSKQRDVLVIKPDLKGMERLRKKIRDAIGNKSMKEIILKLNPILRG